MENSGEREQERRKLMEKLTRMILEHEEKSNQKQIAVGLILAAVDYLAKRGGKIVHGQIITLEFVAYAVFFAEKVLKPVEEFSNNEDERSVLISRFLKWMVLSLTAPFESALLHQEKKDPV